jgi:hippurate hydrolase
MPHEGNDPIVIAAQIVTALQSVVARNVEPMQAGVITIGAIAGGDTFNVIPDSVTLRGTARWFKPEVGDLLEKKYLAIVEGVAAAFGGTAEAVFERGYPATVNETASTRLAIHAAATVSGEAKVQEMPVPTMGGEDFSYMLNACPGNYIFLGSGKGTNDPALHNARYDFNDEVLPVGASYFATLVEQLLPRR